MIITSERKKYEGNTNIAYEYFSTIDELIKVNRERPHINQNEDHTLPHELSYRFNGCDTYEEAENMALNGWNEILEDTRFENFYYNGGIKIEKMTKQINDVVGYVPVVPNVLLGLPKTMINFTKKKVKSKILHIVYGITVPASVDEKELKKIGFEFMKAVVNLEKQGYRLKLTAMQEYSEDKDTDILFIKVKDEFKKLDLQSSMFTLIHPSVFRAIGFVWKERSSICEYMSGYGRPYQGIFLEKNIKTILKDENLTYISANSFVNKENITFEDIEKIILKRGE